MENVEYVYTGGMTEREVSERLREETTGVLALADEGRAYALPVGFAWDEAGGRLLFRLGDDGRARKIGVAATTTEATFLLYDAPSPTESWSVVVTGPIAELSPADVAELPTARPEADADDGGDGDGRSDADDGGDGDGRSDADDGGKGDAGDGSGRDVDESWINERFGPLRLFDEEVDDVDVRLYALSMEEVIGRRTLW
jgi:hypothetical protein